MTATEPAPTPTLGPDIDPTTYANAVHAAITDLIRSGDLATRIALAKSEIPLTEHHIDALIADTAWAVRKAVARSPHTFTPTQIRTLTTDRNLSAAIYQSVGLTDIPRRQWHTLFTDPNTPTRTRLFIATVTTNSHTIRAAATHPDPHYRAAAATNPATTDQTLTALADDPDPRVQTAVTNRLIHAATH